MADARVRTCEEVSTSEFAQGYDKRGYTREHFESWTTVEDIALITSMGIRKRRE
jgi:hypothetical protein